MAARPYPPAWESDAVLSDGGTVHVRPITPDDATRLVAFHGRLSPETVQLRFFSPRPELSPVEVERFTTVDYADRMALVATLGDDIIGVARYDRIPDSDDGEVAFVIEDAHQGRGVGTLLLEHLAAVGRDRGLHRFVAETLPHNRRMLGVFRDAGFQAHSRFQDGVVHVEFPIDPTGDSLAVQQERERRSEARSVARLLEPRSIAVVGASRTPGTIGHELFMNLLRGGFEGPVYPVHPTAPHVASVRAYPSVLAVPDDVDLAVIIVPAEQVPAVVGECATKHVRGLVVISAGFSETGSEGAAAERELVALARGNGMRLIGPNCMGVVNTAPGVGMNATFSPAAPVPGRVGFLSQSGALGIAVLDWTGRLGIGVSSFVSVGNKADVSGNDLVQYWEDDPQTDVVLLYLESCGNPRKFARVARRVSRRKPIVAVKSGRSRAGERAASSHTAAAASTDVAVDALFRQTGVIRVDTLEQLFDVAQVLAYQPLPPGRRVAIVGNSGGPGILAADACEGAGLSVPLLSDATQAALRSFLPSTAAVRNPVDMVAAATAEEYERALRLVLDDDGVDAVITIFTPTLVTDPHDLAEAVAGVSAAAPDKPLVASFLALGGVPGALGEGPRPVPSFTSPESAAHALARCASYAEWRARPEGSLPALDGIDSDRARALVAAALEGHADGRWLDGSRAAELLGCYGVPVAETVHAATADDAASAAERLGLPVALKAAAGQIVHKTDVGGVRLGLSSAGEVRQAFDDMAAALGEGMGGAVVQAMVPAGVETIVGVVQDRSFGPLVMFGMGGIATDLLGDRAFRILPLTDVDAAELVRSVRGAPLLFGYRGAAPADVAALEDVLLRVGRLVDEVPEVAEMDLNPVIVGPDGATVVDVKVRLVACVPHPEQAVRRLR